MRCLPKDKNKLTQAILRRDWQAVKLICQSEPDLVNTSDEKNLTPLAHALSGFHVPEHPNQWRHTDTPEHIILILVENASDECINNFPIGLVLGVTDIIQLLAINSYAKTLKLVLEVRKKKLDVNIRSIFGWRTPLHLCLGSPQHTFERHKDTAMCLVTYGASCLIRDNYGDTAIDLYNKNECLMYDQKTKAEKKATLINLLADLSVPAAILAQGEQAVDSFKDEITHGEITIVNCRSMFLGKEGVGKTSCIKAIFGEKFDENEPSTDGIVTKTVFQTLGDDCSTWKHQEVDECERTKQNLDEAIAANIANKLINQGTEPINSNTTRSSTVQSAASQEKMPANFSFGLSNAQGAALTDLFSFPEGFSRRTVLPMTQSFDMRKRLLDKLSNQGSNLSDITSVWDYAGQLEYYITHRFFLTDGSCYCIVFSLLDNMDQLAKPRNLYKGQFEMTNLQVTVFWVRSIYEFGILRRGAENKSLPYINGKIASPPICIVATHKDQLTGSEEEKNMVIEVAFNKIFADIRDKPYEIYVDHEMYVVDNTNPMDEGIQKLKKTLGSYMKQMARTVPISYVDLQYKLQEVGKSKMRIKLDEAIDIADGCGISPEKTMHVINYLSDVGVLLYLPTNKKLKNIVVTNVQMLIKLFMKIVTVVKPDDPDKKGVVVMRRFWEQLDKYGILDERLLRYLLRNELADDEGADAFEVFVELLKTFSLMFEKKSQKESRTFIVPSRITEKTDNLEIEKDNGQTESVYVIPEEFLPDAVYNVLIVKFLDKCQSNTFGGNHELFQNQAKIGFDNIHYLRIGAVQIHNKRALKIEITRLSEKDENGHKKPATKPESKTCKKVLETLRVNLDELYPSSSNYFGYTIKILCPECSADPSNCQEPHFLNLDECLKVESFPCNTVACSTAGIWRSFKEDLIRSTQVVEEPTTVIAKTPKRESKPSKSKNLQFKEFLQSFSKEYRGMNFRILRFLLYEHLDISELDREDKSSHGLLNKLAIHGRISISNVSLLSEIAELTDRESAITKVYDYRFDIQLDDEDENYRMLTQYRKDLFRALNAVTTNELQRLIDFYQLEDHEFFNIWDVVFHLEKEKLLMNTPEELERFAKLLNRTAREQLTK